MSNCHCANCLPWGACCFKGEGLENVVYSSLGDRVTTAGAENQYVISDETSVESCLGFGFGNFEDAVTTRTLSVRCNLNGTGQGENGSLQGIYIEFLTPENASRYTSWIGTRNLAWDNSPTTQNQIVVRVTVTETDNTTDAEVGDTYFYTFRQATVDNNKVVLLASNLQEGSSLWPDFSIEGRDLWGDKPDIAVYPLYLYHEEGCTYIQQAPCNERSNSTCWIVEEPCILCPSEGGSTVDECGCWRDTTDDGINDVAVCNGGCGRGILDTCNISNSTVFQPAFFNKSGVVQDGFKVGSTGVYENLVVPTTCGPMNCDSFDDAFCFQDCCQEDDQSVGELDKAYSGSQTQDFCQQNKHILLSGTYKNILRRCGKTGAGFGLGICGDCCNCQEEGVSSSCANIDSNPFDDALPTADTVDNWNVMPKFWYPVYSTLTIPANSIRFVRDTFVNKMTARTLDEGGVPSANRSIPITNASYAESDGVHRLAGIYKGENVLGHPGDPAGSANQKAFAFMEDDWKRMDTTWNMKTYCLEDVNSELGLGNDGYREMFAAHAANNAWYSRLMDTEDPVFLRVWTEKNRTVVKDLRRTQPSSQCCQTIPTDDNTDYRLDMHYKNDSQTERGELNNGIGSCENTETCKWGNPYTGGVSEGNEGQQATWDSSGNLRTEDPTDGDYRYPIVPTENSLELWYIGERDTICADTDEPRSYPDNFRLMGIINEIPDCASCRTVGDVALLNNNNGNNDTCEVFYHHSHKAITEGPRQSIKRAFILPDDDTLEPWNQVWQLTGCDESNNTPCNFSGVDDSTLTRKITLSVEGISTKEGKDDENEETNDNIQQLNPPSSPDTDWKDGGTVAEANWYHADPKHDFDQIAKGRPQVIARFTEMPFVNVNDRFLDDNETIPGFYLPITAFHMDGIDRVEFYLDGGDLQFGNNEGAAVVTERVEHPLEPVLAKITRDETTGEFHEGLREYIVKIPTEALSTGSHEVRAKVYPKPNSEGFVGVPRFIYGEPPTGDADVLLEGQTKDGRVAGDYVNYGPIKNKTWPVSKAVWPHGIPDGTELEPGGPTSDRALNPNPIFGSTKRWNLANNGFNYQSDGSGTIVSYPANRYIFSATNQQKLLQNGYESYWFNYNPAPARVWVGTSLPAEAPEGSPLVGTIWEAFVHLKNNVTGTARHDAEIILVDGTTASPAEYWWPNAKRNPGDPSLGTLESFTSSQGFSTTWCENAPEKKALVIKGENPESKNKVRILFPPGSDRAEFIQKNFALNVKNLTIMTSMRGHQSNGKEYSDIGCIQTSGDNCRLIVENVELNSKCTANITASDMVDGSSNLICGDTKKRDSSGNITGTITYAKCPPPISTDTTAPCAQPTSICGSDCCGANSDSGTDCTDCTTSGCSQCEEACGCKQHSKTWWPFICKDSIDIQTDVTTALLPNIDCGDNICTSGAGWSCKGIFGSDLNTTSPYMCLGTKPEHCIKLGLYNTSLMPISEGTSKWNMGTFGKYLYSHNTTGPTLKNPIIVKHKTADICAVDLMGNQGHSVLMDIWVRGSDGITQPSALHNDFVQWTGNAPQYWKNVVLPDGTAVKDYNITSFTSDPTETTPSDYPRPIRNFNVFIDNRIMMNLKFDNHYGRIWQIAAPSLRNKDLLQSYDNDYKSDFGHPNNFGVFQVRNMAICDVHYEDMAATNQQISPVMNHYYVDNIVVTSGLAERQCSDTMSSTDSCQYSAKSSGIAFGSVWAGNPDTKIAGLDYGLQFGKKILTNVHLANICLEQKTGTDYWFNATGTEIGKIRTLSDLSTYLFDCSFDYGPNAIGKLGSNFNINLPKADGSASTATVPYYWTGSHTPVLKNIRQVRTTKLTNQGSISPQFPLFLTGANKDGSDTHLTTANIKAENITSGEVVFARKSPRIGRTSTGGIIHNPYGSTGNFKVDVAAMTTFQETVWKPSVDDTLEEVKPRTARTVITSSSEETKDGLALQTTNTNFMSAAHCDLLDLGEALTSGGIPNVGGIVLSVANPILYYHNVCRWKGGTCTRQGPTDARSVNANTLLEKIQVAEDGTRSWIDNPDAECRSTCQGIRDHFFVDFDHPDGIIDLTWCPIIDECVCSDID